ncbi:transcription elongation factor spt4 [Tilletia horrida]|uniref:Transcription elongation factor SPT4 n=1 Tax=Tilletia horrida TaxID=155126 RepID=A0AAN6JLA3_9BASI|nr:transcription elongation factor spt4 [Tilletia horrida]KAK0530619.1 transcription elongation factor spt4 [Tilletia horrida]KAK0532217.1 transcription elongation factor spt4 [Tilletia horrida]KAK0564662.1 transcription elongation factor spt4 [Tilletia horrida]
MSKSEVAKLRACLQCNFVQRGSEFNAKGCPNCQESLEMAQDLQRVAQFTTSRFDGILAMLEPEKSWVARWQRIENRVPGLYAVKVKGKVPQELLREE